MHSRQLAIQIRFAAAIICTLSQCSTFTTWQHELYSWNVISRVEAKIAKMKGPAKRHQLSISAQISYFSSLLLIQHINSNNFLKFLSVIRIFQQCRLHKLSVIVWSISACRKGTRQAWAMLQTHFPSLDIWEIAEVGPDGPDAKEIRPDSNFEWVIPLARMTEKDCRLDKSID